MQKKVLIENRGSFDLEMVISTVSPYCVFILFCRSKTVSVLHNNYTWTVPNEKKIRRFNDDVVSLYTMTEHYVSKAKVCKECVVSIQSVRNVKASESTFVIALRQRMSYNRYTDAHK